MIDFSDDGIPFRFFDNTELEEVRDNLQLRIKEIRATLSQIGNCKIYLGFKLIDLYKSKDYAADQFLMCNSLGISGKKKGLRESFAFFAYCEKYFYLDKSQVSRYMNVADEFGDMSCGVKPEWKYYSYSQLVELLPLSSEQRKAVKSDWTVKRIREYKQNLVATSQQNDPTQKPVATSQRKEDTAETSDRCSFEYECVCIPFGRNDLSMYTRFSGLTQKALCDKYLELEKKYTELCETFNIRISEESEATLCRN
ncbi:MAG: hypothetical protein HFJ22_07230 [Clostridia bacterium]|nr:hypothetical protein [Clostridia bacterium]